MTWRISIGQRIRVHDATNQNYEGTLRYADPESNPRGFIILENGGGVFNRVYWKAIVSVTGPLK